MTTRFFSFSAYHGKHPVAGSTHIRVEQLIKYWEDADLYKYGENPDVLIFQKVYTTPDYKFHASFKNIKILDVCDPDYLDGLTSIKETIDNVDAVTCSSDALTQFMSQLTEKPVVTVPDRFDLSIIPEPKTHTGDAKKVVWFGYRHNAECLKFAMKKIQEMGLSLIVISDDDPLPWQWLPTTYEEFKNNNYEYIKYNEETIYHDLQKADYCLLPYGARPIDEFKSNNKTIKAILAGLPVAKDAEQMELFAKAENRIEFMAEIYEKTRKEYDVLRSIEQYKELIDVIRKKSI